MAKYHINPVTGKPGVCKATVACRFDTPEDEHYDSPEAARIGYEEKMNQATHTAVSKRTATWEEIEEARDLLARWEHYVDVPDSHRGVDGQDLYDEEYERRANVFQTLNSRSCSSEATATALATLYNLRNDIPDSPVIQPNPRVTVSLSNLNNEVDREALEPLLRKLGGEAIETAEELYNKELPTVIRNTTGYEQDFKLIFKADMQFDGAAAQITPALTADIEFAKDANHDPFELAQQLIVRELLTQLLKNKKTP